MIDFSTIDWLDVTTTLLGLIYIYLEYRASILLWIVCIIMPAMDIFLYWEHGLYGDAGMAIYYTFAALYGYALWKWGNKNKNKSKHDMPITHMPLKHYMPATIAFVLAWLATYYVLTQFTNSNVPLLDSFTNALSFVGLWALARKYVEQWIFWIVVDVVCCALYFYKDIPFKGGLYGLYVIIAILGYYKWKSIAKQRKI